MVDDPAAANCGDWNSYHCETGNQILHSVVKEAGYYPVDIVGSLSRCSIGNLAYQLQGIPQSAKGVVLLVNSPGGETYTVLDMIEQLQGVPKPKAAYITGSALSGAYWLVAATCGGPIIARGPLCKVGSIGAYLEMWDDTEMLTRMGVKVHTVYSTLSGLKNAATRRALEGDYTQLQREVLDPTVTEFLRAVQKGRALAPDQMGPVEKGQVLSANEAAAGGFIDMVGNIRLLLERFEGQPKRGETNAATLTPGGSPGTVGSANTKNVEAMNEEGKNLPTGNPEGEETQGAGNQELEAKIRTVEERVKAIEERMERLERKLDAQPRGGEPGENSPVGTTNALQEVMHSIKEMQTQLDALATAPAPARPALHEGKARHAPDPGNVSELDRLLFSLENDITLTEEQRCNLLRESFGIGGGENTVQRG